MLQISDCTIFLFIEFWDEEEYDKFAVFLKPPSKNFFVEINSNFDFCLPSYLHTRELHERVRPKLLQN